MPMPADKTAAELLANEHDVWLKHTVNTIIANNARAGSPSMPAHMLIEQLDLIRSQSHLQLTKLFFDEK